MVVDLDEPVTATTPRTAARDAPAAGDSRRVVSLDEEPVKRPRPRALVPLVVGILALAGVGIALSAGTDRAPAPPSTPNDGPALKGTFAPDRPRTKTFS